MIKGSPGFNCVGGGGDQGGLPKSVFLQAGTQPSQGHPEPSTQAQSRHRAACHVQQSPTPKSFTSGTKSPRLTPPWHRMLVSLHQHLSIFLSSHLSLCRGGKAPVTDFRLAPKLRICPSNGGVFTSDKSLHSSCFLDESPHALQPTLLK